jgi:hypothetical protein
MAPPRRRRDRRFCAPVDRWPTRRSVRLLYRQFLDSTEWPGFMRAGRARSREALEAAEHRSPAEPVEPEPAQVGPAGSVGANAAEPDGLP